MDKAWTAVQDALLDGWQLAGVMRCGPGPMQAREWRAEAWGPWQRSSRSRTIGSGYGSTPVKALTDLAARLRAQAISDIDNAGF